MLNFLEEELDNWFFNILLKAWKSFAKKIETESDKNFSLSVAKQFSGLKVREEDVKRVLIKNPFPEKVISWSDEDLKRFASALRNESKPTIIVANKIDLEKSPENYEKLKLKFPNLVIIPCSADSELALREANKADLIEYIPGEKNFELKNNLNEKQKQALESIRRNVLNKFGDTGVQAVLNYAIFDLLEYSAIFPVESANKLSDKKGKILPDCFLMPKNSTAQNLAYFLHTDFGNNFIKAIDARTKKILGRDYKLKHRDVLEIVIR